MTLSSLEVTVQGMDCVECTVHIRRAIESLPGVESVEVYLASEKAVIQLDPARVDMATIRKAVEEAGYSVPIQPDDQPAKPTILHDFTRQVLVLLGVVFGAVLFIMVVGEWLGLFEAITKRIPLPLGLAIVLAFGYPVFRNVARATVKGQVIAHTLMTLGAVAALLVGEWATAAVVVFFMRVGDYAERFTTERARRAVRDLVALAPQTARLERNGQEIEVPIGQVLPGEVVIIRPGEKIPVDGEVIGGHATLDQATITGESMPVEAGYGARVFAATLGQYGSLRIRTTHVGPDTTFGRVIRLVEEAESHRAEVQRVADRFSAYYLPVVAGIAALTFILRRDTLATAAVLVVACSCSFALATPIAMLASIGAAAKRGVMIKGGKYLETLARADVLLIDKTGTLTLGKPQITDIVVGDQVSGIVDLDRQPGGSRIYHDKASELLWLAASAERYSEHPLAEAVRIAARQKGMKLYEPQDFITTPGQGVQANFDGKTVFVGNRRWIEEGGAAVDLDSGLSHKAGRLEAEGKTLLFVVVSGKPAGFLAAADTLRPEVPQAIAMLRSLGIRRIELLTGDNQQTADTLAQALGLACQAELLPEDKIRIVREYQAAGRTVVMVGDGVNDAPALAQADVGIVMGAAGSDIALEAAHIALMREDWLLVPHLLQIARRTMRVVKTNIAFTAVYNVLGLSLASMGYLPPIFAAAAQSLPDLGILANSSRLLRQR